MFKDLSLSFLIPQRNSVMCLEMQKLKHSKTHTLPTRIPFLGFFKNKKVSYWTIYLVPKNSGLGSHYLSMLAHRPRNVCPGGFPGGPFGLLFWPEWNFTSGFPWWRSVVVKSRCPNLHPVRGIISKSCCFVKNKLTRLSCGFSRKLVRREGN